MICYVLTCSDIFNLVCHVTCYMNIWQQLLPCKKKHTFHMPKKVRTYCIHHPFTTMCHVWIRAVQDDDHLSQGFFHSYVRTFFCSQLCLHFLLSHSVLDCPSYRYFLWLFVFILQIVPTFLGVAGSGFWAMFVIQQTNRLMQPLIYIYISIFRTRFRFPR